MTPLRSIPTSSLLPLLLLLLLPLIIFVSQVEAVVTYQKDGEPEQELSSNNFPDTTFTGPICSPLVLLVVDEGCLPKYPANHTTIPAFIVDADTFFIHCRVYADLVAQLDDDVEVKPTLVVFPSPYTTEVGTMSEPFGDLSRSQELVERGDYALVVVSRSAGVLMTENRELTICTTSDKGSFLTFFASPGWIVYQVIFCIGFGSVLILSVLNLVLSLMEPRINKMLSLLIFSTAFMGLARLLEFAIDFLNHLGRIHVVAWGFLYMAGSISFFMCTSLLINAWSKVASHTLKHPSAKRMLYFLRINVYIFLPVCFLFFLTSLLRWGLREQVPAMLPPVFAGVLLIFSTIVGISFLVLGVKILLLLKRTTRKDHQVAVGITVTTTASVTSILLAVVVFAVRFYYGVVTQDIDFASNMVLIVLMDLLQVIVGASVLFSISMQTMKKWALKLTSSMSSKEQKSHGNAGDGQSSTSKSYGDTTLCEENEAPMQDLQKEPA